VKPPVDWQVERAPEGILLVDKPAGVSSHAVVARVRKALSIRKVGHAGTLDPDATGLLVVGVGRATRLLGYLTKSMKSYASTIRLGVSTDTDDAAGQVLDMVGCHDVTDDQVRSALSGQVGTIEQVPSAVSAVKVDGKRAYSRVRAGESVDLAARRVTIHALDVLGIHRDALRSEIDSVPVVDVGIEVTCSAGTYIRAIARDVGASLGVGGHVVTLRRTRAGDFHIGEAHSLQDVTEAGSESRRWLMSMRDAAMRSMPHFLIDDESALAVRHGRKIPWPGEGNSPTPEPTALIDADSLVGIGERSGAQARYLAVFD
jgi:tRNA pseudouridine55 synthase